MKTKKVQNKMRGYVTLVVVIMFVPFLLLQGINLVNMSIDITHISGNSVASNNQYIEEQTCWEEILYFMKNNSNILGQKNITSASTICEFVVEESGINNYKISLESNRYNYFSTSEKHVFYDGEVLKYISSL